MSTDRSLESTAPAPIRARRRIGRAGLGVLGLCLCLAAPSASGAPGFKVVAHPGVPARVTRQDMAAVFLSTSSRWGNGQTVVPVDQSARSPVRAAFSMDVLGQSVTAVQAHWVKRISSRQGWPPQVKGSDAEVLAFVAATPGAVGYVSAATSTEPGVRELQIE